MMRRMIGGLMAIAVAAIGGAIFAVDVATAGGGCHGETTAPGGDAVTMEFCQFAPGTLHVEAGTTVTFTNNEAIAHAVTGDGWGSTRNLAEGDSFSQTFETEGVFAYSCYLHPGMVGAIVVGDGGGADGFVAEDTEGDQSDSGRWSLAMVGALTGMMATGAAGLAFGRRANR